MRLLAWLAARMKASRPILARGERLCPNCIYIRDDHGEIVEVIDCQTLNHHYLEDTK